MAKFSVRPSITFKGRKFLGLRGFTGKPLHPPLTDVPIGAYVLAVGAQPSIATAPRGQTPVFLSTAAPSCAPVVRQFDTKIAD